MGLVDQVGGDALQIAEKKGDDRKKSESLNHRSHTVPQLNMSDLVRRDAEDFFRCFRSSQHAAIENQITPGDSKSIKFRILADEELNLKVRNFLQERSQ